ncbi:Uncharacterised protein [Mycobacteroides abscessus subsp. abscessus]|uniref:hypothetical protein n=1 Tax=Mycobacteroides abscessus TaxID=36809 RepID=UPI000928A899|nr:hypothetical protein [Mycobacteroides abscessus]SIG30719.1 Uncharacterised protein [Mycobacteroides abscessus subsp. abscessus]SIH56209.1 Uncharacterised protein [Mycobacteroides abscessus subsp. abscessus]SKW04677.1 Uncharacterised protein [Mycobacteroides abscessus subsp. abscessus]
MPREYGRMWFSMWTDEDFCAQEVFDKLLFCVLIAQPAMNYAGVQPINMRRWRKALRQRGRIPQESAVEEALVRLERSRYVFTDEDTGETLVRSFMRRDEVGKQPNVMLSALRSAAHVESPKLAYVLAGELERVPLPSIAGESPKALKLRDNLKRAHAEALAHLGTLTQGLSEPFPEPFGEGFDEGLPEGFTPPGEMEPFPKPFGEGFASGSGQGEGQGVISPSVGTWFGERSAPPPEFCPKHPGGTDDPCRACQRHRERREAWDAERPAREKAERRARIAACTECGGRGWIDNDHDSLRRCQCNPEAPKESA